MQHDPAFSETDGNSAFSALVRLLEESCSREWNVNFLIAIKAAAEATGPIPYPAFAESIAFAEQVLRCRDYYAGISPKGSVAGRHPLSVAIETSRTQIQSQLRNDFDLAHKAHFGKERGLWILATIRILQRTLGQIADVLPTCRSKVHSAVRSFDVFLCAILTAQTPCFTFAALGTEEANAVKVKLCEDVTELVSLVQQLERNLRKELEQLQENKIRSNFIAANLPPPEIPPQEGFRSSAAASLAGGSPSLATARRRERELTAVDFAHMEAVFKIREIYRKRNGTLSYAEIARYQFDHHYKDRLTVNGIVQVSVRTLADHAKKKTWPPSRWRTAYNQKEVRFTATS